MKKHAFGAILISILWSSLAFITLAAGQPSELTVVSQPPLLPQRTTSPHPVTAMQFDPVTINASSSITAWNESCASHRMKITGLGMGGGAMPLNPQTVTLTNPTEVTWLLAQVAGRYGQNTTPPDNVTFTSGASQSVIISEPTRNSQEGYTFETLLQPTGHISAFVSHAGDGFNTPRGLILYAKRDTGSERWTSIGRTTNDFVYRQDHPPKSHTFTFTPLAEATDLSITAVVIDNNNDDRPLELNATAGGITDGQTFTGPTDGDLLNIVSLTLPQVPAETDHVTVTLSSPAENGDSLILAGVNVSYQCGSSDGADLAVAKSVNNSTPDATDTIVYTTTVTNNGTQDATGVHVADPLPIGVSYVPSYTASHGTYSELGGVWIVGDLDRGEQATLTITATVNSCTNGKTIAATATILAADQFDPISSNNEARVDINVGSGTPCYIYLPIILHHYAACQFYDFSFEEGDWANYEDEHTKSGYIDGEFQIRAKSPDRTHVASPVTTYEHYQIRTKARWLENSIGDKYGLTFGIADNLSFFYTFMVYPQSGNYEIKYYNGTWHTIYAGNSSAINPDLDTNWLGLERLNNTISISVNNTLLAENIEASQITGNRHVGVGVGPYNQINANHVAEARFDDYKICPLVEMSGSNIANSEFSDHSTIRSGSVTGG